MKMCSRVKSTAASVALFVVFGVGTLVTVPVMAQVGKAPELLNPRGQAPTRLVREVMKEYGIEHGELKIVPEGMWVFESEKSATVAFETNQRAGARLDYGETEEYGKSIVRREPHYIHLFHLTDLASDRTYHFRMTGVDHLGQTVKSKDYTLATRTVPGVVRIPDDLAGPPYVLDQPNTYYLVTRDFVAPRTAFDLTASGITLDLGGHTVTYNNEHLESPSPKDSSPAHVSSAFGIRENKAGQNIRVFNGTLIQGKGENASCVTSFGYNPLYLRSGAGAEIAGLSLIYSGPQMSGMIFGRGAEIKCHHNVIEDRGKIISNRHQMVTAIRIPSPGGKTFNNLVKRSRQTGINISGANGAEAHSNEIHIDSYSVNSIAVWAGPNAMVYHNKIFGCGNHVVGLQTTGGVKNVRLRDNYVWLHAHDMADRREFLRTTGLQESIPTSTVSGCRITWGCDDIEYSENRILVTGRDGGIVRGTWLSAGDDARDAVFSNNVVIALAEDDKTKGSGAIGGAGSHQADALPILFRENIIVSNFRNFSLQDTYGTSMNYRFVRNRFVRVGDRPAYETIGQLVVAYPSFGHLFVDSEFEGGAGYDKVRLGRHEHGIAVQWTLTVSTQAEADVSVKDRDGKEVFAGKTGADGKLSVPLTQYRQGYGQAGQKTLMTPHTVRVSKDGRSVEKEVVMDKKRVLEVNL